MTTGTPLSRSPWARARWLVLAPHQDDETLGAGALIAETAADGRLAAVAYLTDGAGSHPSSCRGLRGIRRREARHAVRRLCRPHAPAVVDFGWPDAQPFAPGARQFEGTVGRLAALLRRARIDAIAVTADDEAHCDHVAAYRVAAAAISIAHRPVALFRYRVWSEQYGPRPAAVLRTKPMPAGLRRSALRAHRSQLSPSMGPGFRLPVAKVRMMPDDLLYLARR